MRTKRAVKKALRADKVTTAKIPNGTRFEIVRGECRAKFDLYEDHVNWVSLTSPGGEGWTKDIFEQMGYGLFPKWGVKYIVAEGRHGSEELLKQFAPWERGTYNGKSWLRWDLEDADVLS